MEHPLNILNSGISRPCLPFELQQFELSYDFRSGGWHNWPSHGQISYDAVELEVGHLLHILTHLIRPQNVIEIGRSRGYSTACIASALQQLSLNGHIWTIDPTDRPQAVPEKVFTN